MQNNDIEQNATQHDDMDHTSQHNDMEQNATQRRFEEIWLFLVSCIDLSLVCASAYKQLL